MLWPAVSSAQAHHHPAAADTATGHTAHQPEPKGHMHGMEMTGTLGPYGMSREASGTSWQPDAARHEGMHLMAGPWMLMLHGFADVVYDDQGGPRGDTKVFSSNMGMATAQRALGPGRLGLRSMLSLEPATIGK